MSTDKASTLPILTLTVGVALFCVCLQRGLTLLHFAVVSGSIELVDWLAERHNLNIGEWDRVSLLILSEFSPTVGC